MRINMIKNFVDTPFGTLSTTSDASELGGSLMSKMETEGVIIGVDNGAVGVTVATEEDKRN